MGWKRGFIVGACALWGWAGLGACDRPAIDATQRQMGAEVPAAPPKAAPVAVKPPEPQPAAPPEPEAAPAAAEAKGPSGAPAQAEAPSKAAPRPAEPAAPAPLSFKVTSGKASFLIDAPLEKIKGQWGSVGGELTLDPKNLSRSRGTMTLDLTGLKTTTFKDASENATQTEHALNWMEIGSDVSREVRARNAKASFKVTSMEAVPPQLAAAVLQGKFHAVLRGKLMLHGVESEHVVDVDVELEAKGKEPERLHIFTVKPLLVSLKHHDIKPRDLAGRFLAGALEQVGKKISDTVQVTIDARAERK